MFPIQSKYSWPTPEGEFAAVRKFDIHTGVDLYCDPGTKVYAVEDGIVIAVEDFTGPKAGSPWWNDTQAILIKGQSGVICYGEVDCLVNSKDKVIEGQLLGIVKTVLKKDKGKPMTMLHFELYEPYVVESVVWNLNKPKPKGLLDPTDLLRKLQQ